MYPHNLKVWSALALFFLALSPAAMPADWLGFRNDLQQPVTVRIIISTPNGARAGGVFNLFPGEVRWDLVQDNSPRMIVISDPKPPRKSLLQKQIEAPVRGDVLYSIQGRTNPQTNTTIVDLVLLAGRRR